MPLQRPLDKFRRSINNHYPWRWTGSSVFSGIVIKEEKNGKRSCSHVKHLGDHCWTKRAVIEVVAQREKNLAWYKAASYGQWGSKCPTPKKCGKSHGQHSCTPGSGISSVMHVLSMLYVEASMICNGGKAVLYWGMSVITDTDTEEARINFRRTSWIPGTQFENEWLGELFFPPVFLSISHLANAGLFHLCPTLLSPMFSMKLKLTISFGPVLPTSLLGSTASSVMSINPQGMGLLANLCSFCWLVGSAEYKIQEIVDKQWLLFCVLNWQTKGLFNSHLSSSQICRFHTFITLQEWLHHPHLSLFSNSIQHEYELDFAPQTTMSPKMGNSMMNR